MVFPRRRRTRSAHRKRQGLRFEALEARRVLATFFVGTTDDDVGTCVADDQAASSNCSIRSAIVAAEANAGPDTIQIPSGTYVIGDSGSFDLFEAQDLTFQGTGGLASDVVIDGQGGFRGFDILGSGDPYTITYQNLTIQNTLARDGSGGGAINAPRGVTLILDNVVLQDNIADFDAFSGSGLGSSGGAISTSGPVVISNSRFFRNQATESGGALDLREETTITNSVFRDNVALDNGGAIRFADTFDPLQLPTAVDDSLEVPEGSVNRVLNVLDNDVSGVIGGETITNVSAGSAGGQLAIESDGQSVRYTPQPGFNGTEQFAYSIQDDTGASSTATVTVDLLPGSRTDSMQDPNFDQVEFEIEILDPDTALPVPSVQVGDEFLVRVSVDDRRAFQSMPGVASAFLDLLYSDALVSTVRSSTNPNFPFDISFGPLFSGENGFQSGNAQVPGVITEVGAIQPFGAQQAHFGPTELFTLRMQAVSAGTAVFKGDPVDIGGETLLFGANDALEPAQLRLGRRELLIIPGSGGTPSSNNTLLSIQDTTLENNTTGSFTPDGNIFNDFGFGGAVFTRGASFDLDLQRVVVDGNSAGDSGGGIYVDLGAVTSVDSSFTNNQANGDESGGGGLYVFNNVSNSGIIGDRFNVSGGEFRSNSAVEGAGGFESFEASGVLDNVAFTLNEVTGPGSSFDQGGGAIALISDSLTPTPDVRLQNLQVTQNQAPAAGGIAVVNTDVTLSDSTIGNNTATTAGQFIGGGGIGAVSEGSNVTLQIDRSTISNNTTAAEAGGIGAVDVEVQITDTTIAGNAANGGRAGGIGAAGNLFVPVIAVESSTLHSNTASDSGGGIAVFNANIQLLNTTVTNNSAALGGGIAYSNATGVAESSIVYSTISSNSGGLADNIATVGGSAINVASSIVADGNCAALSPAGPAINSLGFNVDSGNSCNFGNATDLVNTDPLLGPLADNGGPVMTRELLSGSPAIDLALDGPSTDARGVSRPIDGDGDTIAAFDSGAFEAGAVIQQPTLTVKDIVVNEDVGFATVTVALDIASAPFEVDVAASDETAVDNEDYSSASLASGPLSFSGIAGEEQQFTIEIVDDEISEARESLLIQLLNPTISVDISDVGQITINDNDVALLAISGDSVVESGAASFSIELFGDVDTDFDVTAFTRDIGDATAGVDYTPANEILNFSGFDGETKTFTVNTTSDEIVELDEIFEVVLTDLETQGRKIRFAGNLQTDLAPLGQFSPAGTVEASSVTARGDVAFVAVETNTDSQIVALDVSQTPNVTPLDTVSVSGLSPSLVIDTARDLLFVSQRSDGIIVLDISDPSNLTQVGSYSSVGSVDQIVLDGDTAFLATGIDGIEAIDISDPTNIQLISVFDTPGTAVDIQLLGDVALVSDSNALLSLDVSNPASISVIDQLSVPVAIEQIELVGTTLFAAIGSFSDTLMEIFDVSDPENLSSVSTFTGPLGFTDDVVVADGIAFLADQEGGGVLTAVDVTDPFDPQLIVRDDTFFDAHRLAFDSGRLFLNATTGGPGFAVLGDVNIATAQGVILNDDAATLTIGNTSLQEGNQGTQTMSFAVTLNGAVDTSFTVDAVDIPFPGEAESGVDYQPVNTTLTFAGNDGETQLVNVTIISDEVIEPDETITIELRSLLADGRDVTISPPGRGIGTILNDDAGITIDLAITKTDDVDPVDPGGTITYTLVVSNIGSTDATNVSVSDQLPSGVIFESGNVDGDESLVSEDSGQVFAQVGDLAIGESSTLTLVVDVALDAAGTLVNQATVSADEVDSNLSNNTVSEETSVAIILNDDEFTIDEDSPTTSFDVLANDLPQNALTISDVSTSNLGTISIVGGTSLSFTPTQDRFGSETLDYTVDDGFGGQATAQLTIFITGINDPPVAVDDLIVAAQRDNVEIDVATLLQNDSDGPFESGTITVTAVDSLSAAGGTVARVGDTITYTPPDNFTGVTDSFTYTIGDGAIPVLNDSATVTIELPPPPATLSGHIYCDENNNNMEDPGEAVVGTRVFLDDNGNRLLDANERVTFTDSAGDYIFLNLTDVSSTVIATIPSSCASIPERPAVSRSIIDVGRLATSITATDIDSDGDLDLGIAADFSDAVTFLVNDNGNFSRLGATPVGPRPQNISTNRFEGSSLSAVASVGTPTSGGIVTVLEGSSVVRSFQSGNGPIDSVIDDFNNDGMPDIAVASFRTSDVRVLLDLLGLAEETDLANPMSEPTIVGDAPLVRAIDSGDLNQDGNADIILGGFGYPNDETSRLGLLLGDGQGNFAEPVFADPIRQLVDIQVAPLMEDEPSDGTPPSILTLSELGELAVFRVEDGNLIKVNSTSVSAGSSSFDVGNFNNDQFLDVAIANTGAQRIDLLIGDGEGRFAPITTITDVSAPSDLVVGDFDGDGIDDIAVSNLYRDVNTDPQGSPQYRLPSTATILLLNAAESNFVITGGVAATVDFVFQNANPRDQFDVTGDGDVDVVDALQVINTLARQSMEGEWIATQTASRTRTDVNQDGRTNALDALLVINHLARQNVVAEQISLLDDEDDDEEQRIAAIDLILTQFLGEAG